MFAQNFKIDIPELSGMITICEIKKDNLLKGLLLGIRGLLVLGKSMVLVFIKNFLILVELDSKKVIFLGIKVVAQLKNVNFVKKFFILLDIGKENIVQEIVYINNLLEKIILAGKMAVEQKEKKYITLKNIKIGEFQFLKRMIGLVKNVLKEVVIWKHITSKNGVNFQN